MSKLELHSGLGLLVSQEAFRNEKNRKILSLEPCFRRIIEMEHYRALAISEMQDISGGNAAGNAVIGGLGGLKTGITFCKIPHPVLKGVCIDGFTALGVCLAYKVN